MKKAIRNLADRKDFWLGIAGAVGVIVTGEWLASALLGAQVFKNWFSVFDQYTWLNIPVAMVLFAFFFFLVFRYRKAFLLSRSFHYEQCKHKECIIMILTLPTKDIQIPSGPLPWSLEKKNQKSGETIGSPVVIEGQSLIDDTTMVTPLKWNWQQLMRALIPHLNYLKEVRLIGSPDRPDKDGQIVKGSKFYAEKAKILVNTYYPDVEVNIHPKAVDFEDFNALKSELNEIMTDLKKKNKYSADQIIMDVTGGQKTASIAAATVTLSSQMNFQYVRTVDFGDVPLNKDVMSYDVRLYSPVSEGG